LVSVFALLQVFHREFLKKAAKKKKQYLHILENQKVKDGTVNHIIFLRVGVQTTLRNNIYLYEQKLTKLLISHFPKNKCVAYPKKTFYLKLCMETPENYQKSKFNTSKVKKKSKNTYGVCRLNPK
jgi:hypothetical protein